MLGPVSRDVLLELLANTVIEAKVLVARDDGEFLPLGEFPELDLTTTTTRKPNLEGVLEKDSILRVLNRLHHSEANGMLEVEAKIVKKELYLEHGKPVFIGSNAEGDRFGSFLVERGHVSDIELAKVLEKSRAQHLHMGDVLVREGLMNGQAVFESLREHQEARIIALMGWTSGKYRFFAGAGYPGEKIKLTLDLPALLHRAAHTLPVETLEERIAPLMNQRVAVAPRASRDPVVNLFAGSELRAKEAIDGQRTVAEHMRPWLDEKKRRDALTVFYLLKELDLLVLTNPQ